MLVHRRTCSCRPDSAAAVAAASVPSRLLRVAPIRHTHGMDVRCGAAVGSGEGFEGTEDYQAVARQLNALMARPNRITGRELRELVFQKWGRTYDVCLRKFNNKIYLQVMWRFLEQKSFPMTEEEYMMQLDAVAEYLTEWGVVERVKQGIMAAHKKGPGYTGGGNAKCISIPLDVDLSQGRKAEWA